MNEPFHLRPGTNDDVVYRAVVVDNEYRVPERFAPDALVVDIGVHVGAFSHLALSRGAARVVGFEPEPGNYAAAVANLAPFGSRAELHRHAVWRSDLPAVDLPFFKSSDSSNAGGGTLIWEVKAPAVHAVPFDTVIDAVTSGGQPRVSLLKIDCEGAEFPILLTTGRLGAIDRIVGEYHELRAALPAHVRVPGTAEFTIEGLAGHLEAAGFRVTWERQASGSFGDLGLFFAER